MKKEWIRSVEEKNEKRVQTEVNRRPTANGEIVRARRSFIPLA